MKKLTTAQLVKIFAGDLLKLSEHPKYRKELEKQERKKKNEEVLRRMRNKEEPIPETPLEKKIFDKIEKKSPKKIEPIGDHDLEVFLMKFYDYDNEYSDFNLMINRNLLDMAADWLKGAGVMEESDDPEFMESILERLKKYSKGKRKGDERELLSGVEIWEDKNYGESCYIPIEDLDEDLVDDYEFDIGFDKNGKQYKKSILFKQKKAR